MTRPTKKSKVSHTDSTPTTTTTKNEVNLGGDDLEDNLLLDDDYLSPDDTQEDDGPTVPLDDESPYLDSKEEEPSSSKKRKTNDSPPPPSKDGAATKKSKKDKLKSKKQAKLQELELSNSGGKDSTALLPVEALLDRFAEKQKKALPNLSSLELDEMRINQSMILDTSSIETRDSLLSFMKEAIPTACTTLGKMPKSTGSPRVIVLAGAALRVADLCRDVKSFKTKTKDGLIDVGKLFAKHFKLNEHAEYLQKTHVGIAVGTPNRIEKLLNETDSLKLTHLSHLILDTSHLDAKNRSLFDLPDARGDLFKLLGCSKLIERLKEGKMKIVVF